MPDHALWCRWLFNTIAEDGVWGVPRSGLMFRKHGDRLVCFLRMPWDERMPINKDELDAYQHEDFDMIAEQFAAAGISAVWES